MLTSWSRWFKLSCAHLHPRSCLRSVSQKPRGHSEPIVNGWMFFRYMVRYRWVTSFSCLSPVITISSGDRSLCWRGHCGRSHLLVFGRLFAGNGEKKKTDVVRNSFTLLPFRSLDHHLLGSADPLWWVWPGKLHLCSVSGYVLLLPSIYRTKTWLPTLSLFVNFSCFVNFHLFVKAGTKPNVILFLTVFFLILISGWLCLPLWSNNLRNKKDRIAYGWHRRWIESGSPHCCSFYPGSYFSNWSLFYWIFITAIFFVIVYVLVPPVGYYWDVQRYERPQWKSGSTDTILYSCGFFLALYLRSLLSFLLQSH